MKKKLQLAVHRSVQSSVCHNWWRRSRNDVRSETNRKSLVQSISLSVWIFILDVCVITIFRVDSITLLLRRITKIIFQYNV